MRNSTTKKSAKTFSYDELLFKASAYCAMAEHCCAEVSEKLRQWGAAEADAARIVDYLIDQNYISEARYCEAFVRDKFRFNHWGRIKIGVMLRAKGLPSECIAAALAQISDDEYRQQLVDLLHAKERTLRGDDEYERRNKLLRFAQSRGFEPDLILKTLE